VQLTKTRTSAPPSVSNVRNRTRAPRVSRLPSYWTR
jgi:hypothetical protein